MKAIATKTKPFYLDAWEVTQMNPRHPNVAIAMVAACIVHYQRQGMELEAIILNQGKFNLYKDFVRVKYGEAVADQEDFYWHGIQIRKERILSNVLLHVEIKKPKATA